MIRRVCKNVRVQWLEEVFDHLLQKIFIDMLRGLRETSYNFVGIDKIDYNERQLSWLYL